MDQYPRRRPFVRFPQAAQSETSVATLLAKNDDVLVTMDGGRRELKTAGLYDGAGIIRQVGPNDALPVPAETVID